MRQKLLLLLGIACLVLWNGSLSACNLADYHLVSKSYNSFTQQWTITTQLYIGSGRTGSTLGADQATRSIAIGFYKTCPAFTLYSFSPASITGPTTGCVMPGAIFTTPALANSQAYVLFNQPPTCGTNGFACVTTTAACGNVAQTAYTLTFVTNVLPDSIRAFGVEGNGNLLGGCYPNFDMKIDFCALNGCPFSFPMNCPGTQTLAVGPTCSATLPSYSSLATFPPPPCPVTVDSVTQSPAIGTFAGTPGSAVSVSLFGHAGTIGVSTCTFLVNVVDATPPTINCPGNASVTLNASCQASLPSFVGQASATDNCAGVPTITQLPTAGTLLSGSGTTTVTLRATDAASNTSTCTLTVTRIDNTPPAITCPANASVTLNASCQASLPSYASQATATDNCAGTSVSQSPAAGTLLSGSGTTSVTLTATDAAGNTGTCTLTVTRIDNTPPSITCPANASISLNASCQASLPSYVSQATATDNCLGTSVLQSPAAGTLLSGSGTTTVTLTATDAASNTSTCTLTVTRIDLTAPSVTCPANASVTLDANCEANLPSYVGQATATDNCAGSPTLSQSPTAGTLLSGSGTTTVTLTATDAAGNTSTCTLSVTRQESTPPTITCPPNATVVLGSTCAAQLHDYTGATTTTDNCLPAPTLVQSPSAGTTLSGIGTTTVTLTATDGAGNTATCALTVTHLDQTPPAVTCPSSFTVTPVGLDCFPTATWAAPAATDNCSVTLVGSHASGDAFPVGATTVTYTATDGAGATATCSFVVTVLPPSIAGTTTQSPAQPCVGDVVTLTALSASSYNWSTGATTQVLSVTTSGWYWVDAIGAPNCTARDSIFVNFAPLPQPVLTQSGNQVCTGSYVSYQWLLNGSPIPGATGACTPIAASGNYSVQVTDSAGCSGTGGPLTVVGMADKPMAMTWTIFPNPAGDALYLQVDGPITEAGRVVLYDLHGRVVLSQPFDRIDLRAELSLAGLPDGSYFVQVQADGYWGMKKVVKLR